MNATEFKYEIAEYLAGTVLEICPGPKSFPHLLKVGTPGLKESPDIRVEDAGDLSLVIEDVSCDALVIRAPLAGFKDYRGSLSDWWRCIKPDGYLIIKLEHDGETPKHVIDAMRQVGAGWDIVRRDNPVDADRPGVLVFRKTEERHTHSWIATEKARPEKSVCLCRFGGFGDMIQTANLFQELKRQGFHITVMTTPNGKNIIRDDPHVDAWFILGTDQVPNHELGDFWRCIAKRYTRFVNLSESVEGTFLAMPGRANHAWPQEVRHKRMNENYLEFASELSGIPYTSEAFFYPTPEETARAKDRLLAGGLNVVFALAGSSVHKFYPHQDAVIARILLEKPECRIFLVGDEACKILEVGWEKESRVVCLSGEMGIRDTLTLAKVADVVIGCETGVLNAVAFEDNRKICLLSHSSHENLTKHWKNTAALAPAKLPCYPCHRLHYSSEFCHTDATTGAALCAQMIPPDEVFGAICHERI